MILSEENDERAIRILARLWRIWKTKKEFLDMFVEASIWPFGQEILGRQAVKGD